MLRQQDSGELLKIIETSREAINIVDQDLRIVYTNRSMDKLFGYKKGELLGKHVSILNSRFEGKKQSKNIEEILKKRGWWEGEIRNRRKNGAEFITYARTSLYRKKENRGISFISTQHDITEVKRIKEEAKERFRGIFDSSKDAIGYANREGVFMDVNAAFSELTGYSKKELLSGKKYQDITPKEYHKWEAEKVEQVINAGIPQEYEKEYIRKDGSRVPILLTVFVVKGAQGKTIGAAAIIKDITERKRAEDTLRESEKLLLEAQKLSQVGSWSWIVKTDTVRWSDELYAITGLNPRLPPPSYAQHPPLYTKESWKLLRDAVKDAVRFGKPYDLKLDMVRPDGGVRHTYTRGQAVKDKAGRVVRLHGTVQDITDREKMSKRQELTARILSTLNTESGRIDAIRKILVEIKKFLGIEAIGIRLKEKEDFPYYVTNGFPSSFIKAEKYLCLRDRYNKIIRDSKGTPYLECMCGSIILGRVNPALPFFTKGGSFWTNSTTTLIKNTAKKHFPTIMRNRCNKYGYESVALIPLRAGQWNIGLLQLNDRRKGMFDLDGIIFLERIAASIGIALSRKNAEQALKDNARRFEKSIDTMLDCFGIYSAVRDKSGRIIDFRVEYVNKKACQNNRMSRKGQTGKTLLELLPAHRKTKLFDRYREVVGNGDSYLADELPFEDFYKGKKIERFFDIRAVKLGDGFAAAWRDVTERVKSQDTKRALAIEKAKRRTEMEKGKQIKDAYDKLKRAQEQLIQAGKLAALGKMAAGLAHELNSPLTGVLGLLRLYRREKDQDAPEYENLSHMIDACELMAKIINDLNFFATPKYSTISKLNLNDVIESTLRFSANELIKTGVKIRKDYAVDLKKINGRKAQIQQVLMNIITNARDAMPKGGRFNIRTRNSDGGEKVILEFSDTGMGIAEKDLGSVFDPFFTTKKPGQGVGLGLSVSHGIIKFHKGSLEVESKKNKGTTFRIIFPAST